MTHEVAENTDPSLAIRGQDQGADYEQQIGDPPSLKAEVERLTEELAPSLVDVKEHLGAVLAAWAEAHRVATGNTVNLGYLIGLKNDLLAEFPALTASSDNERLRKVLEEIMPLAKLGAKGLISEAERKQVPGDFDIAIGRRSDEIRAALSAALILLNPNTKEGET